MPSRRAYRWFALASAAALVTACGLSVVGTAPSPADAGADAGVASDASTAPPDAGALPSDAASEASPDGSFAGDGGHILYRWNIGGPEDPGTATVPGPWLAGPADGGPCGGGTYANPSPIRGTDADELFQTEVFGNPLLCAVGGGALSAGTYRVRMLFAEIYFGRGCPVDAGPGSRVFDVDIEGASVEKNLDLLATVGCAASTSQADAGILMREYLVPVTDGTLNISMPASQNNAKLSALEIEGPL